MICKESKRRVTKLLGTVVKLLEFRRTKLPAMWVRLVGDEDVKSQLDSNG